MLVLHDITFYHQRETNLKRWLGVFQLHSLDIKRHSLSFMFSMNMIFHCGTFNALVVANLTFPIKFASENTSRCHTKVIFQIFFLVVICIIPRINFYHFGYNLYFHLDANQYVSSIQNTRNSNHRIYFCKYLNSLNEFV